MNCELRSEEVEDAAERIRAGQASLEDVRTWLAWPYRSAGPTAEKALQWLLAEVDKLSALTRAMHKQLQAPPLPRLDYQGPQMAHYETLLVRLWNGGLNDSGPACLFCEQANWTHLNDCPWLTLREFVWGDSGSVPETGVDEPEGEPYDAGDVEAYK